jgi:hypothetical protein
MGNRLYQLNRYRYIYRFKQITDIRSLALLLGMYTHAHCIVRNIAPLMSLTPFYIGACSCRVTEEACGRTTRSKRGSKGGNAAILLASNITSKA